MKKILIIGIMLALLVVVLAMQISATRSTRDSDISPESVVILLFIILGGAAVYFIPSFIAFGSNKRNAAAIFLLNLLLGWTLLGWIGALIWSVMVDAEPRRA